MKTPVYIPETPVSEKRTPSKSSLQTALKKIAWSIALLVALPHAGYSGGASCSWWQSGCNYNYSYDNGWLYDTHTVSINCGGSTYDSSWIKIFGTSPDSGMCNLATSNGGSCS